MGAAAISVDDVREFIVVYDKLIRKSYRSSGVAYRSMYDFLVRHGRAWEMVARPDHIALGAPKSCFANATLCAMDNPDMVYVEGYAAAKDCPFPVHHAWVANDDGKAIELTWKYGGIAYFGTAFTTKVVAKSAIDSGKALSMLDDWGNDWPLLCGDIPIDEALERCFDGR